MEVYHTGNRICLGLIKVLTCILNQDSQEADESDTTSSVYLDKVARLTEENQVDFSFDVCHVH